MGGEVRVCSVEDDDRYRESLEVLFALSPRYALTHAFAHPEEAIAAAAAGTSWDVVLMDMDLPGMDGIEATRRLRRHLDAAVPIIVLTAFDDPRRILRAIRGGAGGYLLKRATGDQLLDYLDEALDGGAPLTPAVARSVLDLVRGRAPKEPAPHLAPREREVLEALVRGRSYKQIAADLGLSIDTVRDYVRSLYRKLHVHSATEAVSKALRSGWVD